MKKIILFFITFFALPMQAFFDGIEAKEGHTVLLQQNVLQQKGLVEQSAATPKPEEPKCKVQEKIDLKTQPRVADKKQPVVAQKKTQSIKSKISNFFAKRPRLVATLKYGAVAAAVVAMTVGCMYLLAQHPTVMGSHLESGLININLSTSVTPSNALVNAADRAQQLAGSAWASFNRCEQASYNYLPRIHPEPLACQEAFKLYKDYRLNVLPVFKNLYDMCKAGTLQCSASALQKASSTMADLKNVFGTQSALCNKLTQLVQSSRTFFNVSSSLNDCLKIHQ